MPTEPGHKIPVTGVGKSHVSWGVALTSKKPDSGARCSGHVQWPPLWPRPGMAGASISILAAYTAALTITGASFAKTPGEVHCYNGICHRVKSVEEMAPLVGMETEALTSFYDTAEHDSMNAGTITSSGEEFDADSDTHAASSYYPDGTELLVWNPKNRRAAHIRVNDFGPFYMLRTIDVTRGVAEKLDFVQSGVAKLRIIVLWAPGREDARFRRRRTYPEVEGYLGAIDADQLTALKYRLISTAPVRNGQVPKDVAAVAAVTEPAAPLYSFRALPAYASDEQGNALARRMAAIMNAPRVKLVVNPTAPKHKPASPTVLMTPASPSADQATSTPAGASIMTLVTARDAGIDVAVAIADDVAPAALAAPASVGTISTEPLTAKSWAPSQLLWNQLLVALGMITAATLSLRMRPSPGRGNSMRPLPIPSATAGRSGVPQRADTSATGFIAASDSFPAPAIFSPPAQAATYPSMDALRDQAISLMERYAFGEAETAYRQLLASRTAALGAADPLTASAERQLADCLREQGRYTAAEPHYRQALAAMAAAAGEMHPATADILDDYATNLLRQGHGNRAEILARQSLSIRRATAPREREYAATLSIVAEALRAQGQLVAAEIEHRSAWALFIAVSGEESFDANASLSTLGTLMGELGRFAAAEDMLNSGTRALSAMCGPDHPVTATGYALLGDLYRRAGAIEPGFAMHTHALAIRERVLGGRHPDTVESLLTLATFAAEQYRMDDARLLLDRALDALIGAERNHLGPQSRVRALLVALSHHFDTWQPAAVAAE